MQTIHQDRAAIKEMIVSMSEVIKISLLEEMRASERFALMSDETTDITTVEHMAIHASYIHKDGNVHVHFLKMLDCLERTSAAAGNLDRDIEPQLLTITMNLTLQLSL